MREPPPKVTMAFVTDMVNILFVPKRNECDCTELECRICDPGGMLAWKEELHFKGVRDDPSGHLLSILLGRNLIA